MKWIPRFFCLDFFKRSRSRSLFRRRSIFPKFLFSILIISKIFGNIFGFMIVKKIVQDYICGYIYVFETQNICICNLWSVKKLHMIFHFYRVHLKSWSGNENIKDCCLNCKVISPWISAIFLVEFQKNIMYSQHLEFCLQNLEKYPPSLRLHICDICVWNTKHAFVISKEIISFVTAAGSFCIWH